MLSLMRSPASLPLRPPLPPRLLRCERLVDTGHVFIVFASGEPACKSKAEKPIGILRAESTEDVVCNVPKT